MPVTTVRDLGAIDLELTYDARQLWFLQFSLVLTPIRWGAAGVRVQLSRQGDSTTVKYCSVRSSADSVQDIRHVGTIVFQAAAGVAANTSIVLSGRVVSLLKATTHLSEPNLRYSAAHPV